MKWIRFQPPGPGVAPSAIGRPAEDFGPESSSRRFPRLTSANAGGALVNAILPAVHPHMGTPWSDAEETPILEPPGFLLANYGRRTAIVNILAHAAYGAIIGGFAAGL